MQQQFSILKLTFALVLICFYIFCFGILGTAGDGSGDSYASVEESFTTNTTSTTTTTTPQSTTTITTSQTEQSSTSTTPKAEVTVYSPPKTTTTTKVTNTTTSTTSTTSTTQPPKTTTTNPPIDAEYSLYEYVLMNVQAEMGASFHQEALKAQAIAAYSYIKCQEGRPGYPNVPLANINSVSAEVKKAVDAVFGKGIYYNGKIAETVYHASSGGKTASSKDIWGGHLAYLVSVDCPVDEKYDKLYYGKTTTYKSAELKKIIESKSAAQKKPIKLSGDPSKWIDTVEGDGGYVKTVRFANNENTYTGNQFRLNIMGAGTLKSGKFVYKYDAKTDECIFTTYGYGHGVGLSQHGANFYAKHYGWNYSKILNHYYTGITIK